MKLWKRRKQVDLVASQIEAAVQVETPSEVNFMDTLTEAMNANISNDARVRVPLRDKITMTTLWD
jgi:hypothetical protein